MYSNNNGLIFHKLFSYLHWVWVPSPGPVPDRNKLAATLATREGVVSQLLPVMSDRTSPSWFLNIVYYWTLMNNFSEPLKASAFCEIISCPTLTNYLNVTGFRQHLLTLTYLLSRSTVCHAGTILHQGEKRNLSQLE